MAIQRTRWRPDTCGCVLVYEWDTALSESQRTHRGAVVEQACAVHASQPNPADHHTAVRLENGSKNVAVKAAADSLGWVRGTYDPITNLATIPDTKPLFAPELIPWSFDASRNVVLNSAVLTSRGAKVPEVNAAQTAANTAVTAYRAAELAKL
jgi:hypothetical protein